MSDNIPFEIQIEIVKRVPDVRSLIRFRAVSKPWKTLIDSSEFITGYRARKTHPNTLILSYRDNVDELKHLSVHNDTFTQQQDLAPNVSALMKRANGLQVIGYSRGLLCLHTFKRGKMLFLWNHSLRRSVGIRGVHRYEVFGFAVCPVTNEPTIVKFAFPWVEIFTLSSKKWTVIQCNKSRESIALDDKALQVVIGSSIYRVAYETGFHWQSIVVSFDLNSKELKAIELPDTMKIPKPKGFKVSKLKGSLAVIALCGEDVKVWKMEPDCSFTHLFTMDTPLDSYITNIVGFRKNGELLVETKKRYSRDSALKVYNPCSKQITNLGFSKKKYSYYICTYKETLLLLDQSDSCVYSEIN